MESDSGSSLHNLGCLWQATLFKDFQKGCIRTWLTLQKTTLKEAEKWATQGEDSEE